MTALFAESYFHQLDPFLIEFTPGVGLRWYGLAYAAGFVIAWLVFRWFARTARSPLTERNVGDLMFAGILGVLVGGRLGYVIFYDRSLLFTFSGSFPWWNLLAINKGGMSAHGGIIGVIIACWIFGRMSRVSILHILDLGAFTAPFGLGLGRIANFINAELWGKALPAPMQAAPPAWSIKYPTQITDRWLKAVEQGEQPADEYADLVHKVAADFHLNAPPDELAQQAIAEAHCRLATLDQAFGSSAINDDRFYDRIVAIAYDSSHALHAQVVQTLKPMLTAYYPSQLIQALTDGPILLAILALVWLKPRKPGVVGAWFLIGYAALRIVTETYREPDTGVGLILGLSRGQQLSVLTLLAGIVSLIIASRRNVPKLGGLLRRGRRQ